MSGGVLGARERVAGHRLCRHTEAMAIKPESRAGGMLVGAALLVAALVAAPVALAAAAHSVSLEGALLSPGKLVAGIGLAGKPFAFRRDGALVGFEVELVRALARAMGLELELVAVPRRKLAAALAAGEVDTVTTFAMGNEVHVDGLIPYLVTGDHGVMLKSNPFGVHGADDLSGLIVSVTMGSGAEAFAHELSGRLEAEGKTPLHIHALPNLRYTAYPVNMGHAAAYFVPTLTAIGVVQDGAARAALVEGAFKARGQVGLAVAEGNAALNDALGDAIAGLVASGVYDRLRAEHDLPDELSPFRD